MPKNFNMNEMFLFERNNIGSFIFCNNKDSLKLIKEEILNKKTRNQNLVFNVITNGSSCQDLLDFIKENNDFYNCIENICIFCKDKAKNLKYKDECPKIHDDIYIHKNEIKDFLKRTETENHFINTKLIIDKYYIKFYNSRHFQIAQFYEDLDPDIYKSNIEKIEKIITKEEDKEKKLNNNKIIEGFLKFEIKDDSQNSDELIINEYTKNTFREYLNECLANIDQDLDESIAYFTSRLIFSLNSYAKKNNMFLIEDKKKLYKGIKMPYSRILSYEKMKNQIITFPQFISTSESEFLAKNQARRGDSLELYKDTFHFSVVFIITNIYQSNWISNGINVQNISEYKGEKEILFLPFSFFKVIDIKIDITNYTADIYLETIGKKEILETKIKYGNQIQYNSELNIMEIKEKY